MAHNHRPVSAVFQINEDGNVVVRLPYALCMSECRSICGVCYMLGSVIAFVSIGTMSLAIAQAPSSVGNIITTCLLSVSYALKLNYYKDKLLALLINGLLSVGWFGMFLYALVMFTS